jgi:SAM-dependent MidA family methyltransferase
METMNGAPGNPDMVAIIRAVIAAAGGRIPFARFMALALTHPTHGYYASGRGAPGREGADFLTAPETSPYFGRCLAVQIAECWERMGAPTAFAIWEPGAGAGTLAGTVLDALRNDAPAAYRAATYWLDDLSPLTRERARAALVAHTEAGQIAWGRPPGGFTGIVLANEFVDALPVHRVHVEGGALREAYSLWDDERGAFAEQWAAPSTPALARFLDEGGIALAEGQVAEIALAAINWIAEVAYRIEQGYVITVDYGDTVPALYRPGRFPEGSLMCYYRHTANREPYRHVGEQDMTAHVDFSALERAGTRAGLTTLGLTTQAAFLASLGLGEMLYAATQRATDPFRYIDERNAVVRLIEPSAMGRNRVLLQGRMVPSEPPLRGLAEPPI